MEVLEFRGRFPLANNHLSCIWGLSWLDNSFSKSRAVKPPTGLMWQKKTRTTSASGFLYSAVSQASGIEKGKRILLENPIRESRKYALERGREGGRIRTRTGSPPEVKDFNINKGTSYITSTCFRKPVFLDIFSENKDCKWTGNCFHPKFNLNSNEYDCPKNNTEKGEIKDFTWFLFKHKSHIPLQLLFLF